MGPRKILKWTSGGLSGLAGVVFAANIEHFLTVKGWDTLFTSTAAAKVGGIATYLASPWLMLLATAILGFTAGVWTDIALGKLAANRKPNRFEELGYDAVYLANAAHNARTSYFETDASGILADILSMILKMEQLGFDFPDVGPNASANRKLFIAEHYLMLVGTLLKDGHLEAARRVSVDLCKSLPNTETEDTGRI